MIDLNILKIAGAFIAGLAGLIGILGQTRTQDNKLTRSGKWLFGMAIVGVMLAVSTQIWEWRKSIEDDRTARRKNQELLLKLDMEAQLAADSLHQVRRAVTRFQTISFTWSFDFDSTDNIFAPYIGELVKLAGEAISKPWSSGIGRSDQGLRRGRWDASGVSAFVIDADSPAMPDESKYPNVRHYILEAMPDIFLFKTPIPPANFFATWANQINERRGVPQPDLILKLSSGKISIFFPIQKVEPKVPSLTIRHVDAQASVSFSSGTIVSLEDLAGCQGIIHLLSSPPVEQLWRTASRHRLSCRVNDQRMPISELISAHVKDALGRDELIYSFTFPTPSLRER